MGNMRRMLVWLSDVLCFGSKRHAITIYYLVAGLIWCPGWSLSWQVVGAAEAGVGNLV